MIFRTIIKWHRQFKFGSSDVLDLDRYQRKHHKKVHDWWTVLCKTRRNNALKGPAKLHVRYAEGKSWLSVEDLVMTSSFC